MHLQAFPLVIHLSGDIKGDPAIRLIERYYPDVLQIAEAGASADAQSRGSVRIVLREAEV